MDAELRQVANGFDYKVRSFDKYNINGYHFRTFGKELSMPDLKTTNCSVSAIGEGYTEYYRQVANGFDYKVRSFDKYNINGYHFRTFGKELSMPDLKTTNCSVSAIGEGYTEYYGRVEAIYELLFYGENPPNVVVFKCYWFQPKETRRTHEHIGLVEINQSMVKTHRPL